MSNVLNWQLGREMDYPYEAAYPDHQFAFIFNINRCIGCQTCTMACKSTWTFNKGQEHMWWNNVETKPYGGYPHHWDVKTLNLLGQQNPGGQTWGGKPVDLKGPYGKFSGKTIFEAAKTNVASAPLVVPSGARSLLAQDARETARAADASTASDFFNELWNFNAYTSNLAGNARRWSSICWVASRVSDRTVET